MVGVLRLLPVLLRYVPPALLAPLCCLLMVVLRVQRSRCCPPSTISLTSNGYLRALVISHSGCEISRRGWVASARAAMERRAVGVPRAQQHPDLLVSCANSVSVVASTALCACAVVRCSGHDVLQGFFPFSYDISWAHTHAGPLISALLLCLVRVCVDRVSVALGPLRRQPDWRDVLAGAGVLRALDQVLHHHLIEPGKRMKTFRCLHRLHFDHQSNFIAHSLYLAALATTACTSLSTTLRGY